MKFKISNSINEKYQKEIIKNLNEFNNSQVKENFINEPLEILAFNENNEILGGIYGRSIWGTLKIKTFVVKKEERGKGMGQELIVKAEKEAKNRNCRLISLDTFSFQAPKFYEKLGFEKTGTETEFPKGFEKYYYRKKIKKTEKYLFKSERLGFRQWTNNDLDNYHEINSDSSVMEFFPSTLSKEQTLKSIEKFKKHINDNGFGYYAVEILENSEFIGFIGLSKQNYEIDFAPYIDIGWRLSKKHWTKGYATEGAKRCLKYAFNELNIKNIKAVCPIININSENVMKKIGMKKVKDFKHPLLNNYERIENCVLYEIEI